MTHFLVWLLLAVPVHSREWGLGALEEVSIGHVSVMGRKGLALGVVYRDPFFVGVSFLSSDPYCSRTLCFIGFIGWPVRRLSCMPHGEEWPVRW